MEKTKFTFHKQYFFDLLFAKKTHADESALQRFHCLKKTTQNFKSSGIQKRLLKCVCYWQNSFRPLLFITCDKWKALFFMRVYR